MELSRSQLEQRLPPGGEALFHGALFLDLEVSPKGTILKIGTVLDNQIIAHSGQFDVPEALARLATLASQAHRLIGHNLVRHNLRVLKEARAGHPVLRLPVIDTLALSPLAFPENPFHRLVKDYKLVRESVNDPVADARQAMVLFRDEIRSLDGLRQTEPRLFQLLHYLLAEPDGEYQFQALGMEQLFQSLGGVKPGRAEVLQLGRALFGAMGLRQLAGGGVLDPNQRATAGPRLCRRLVAGGGIQLGAASLGSPRTPFDRRVDQTVAGNTLRLSGMRLLPAGPQSPNAVLCRQSIHLNCRGLRENRAHFQV